MLGKDLSLQHRPVTEGILGSLLGLFLAALTLRQQNGHTTAISIPYIPIYIPSTEKVSLQKQSACPHAFQEILCSYLSIKKLTLDQQICFTKKLGRKVVSAMNDLLIEVRFAI